ncbi:hypothetical protein BT96DRAFT_326862 [Gymnopus androsaceus JB14]|uniref:Uncharacterized protein n=1 Tax=Gymnopus androsaceus JB14 TaxID=1447944 RepID=A0A6A4IA00_9AGAR|nr:hypothetical protein BT96DRAFT_326862 [Gymnopus androsaceus JB14]
MSELNAWLGRDVADRHNEMTAVVHRLEELRASLNELQNRPYARRAGDAGVPVGGPRDEESVSSSEGSPEQQQFFIPGMQPGMQPSATGQPVIPGSGYPPGFVPQPGVFIPPHEPPVVPYSPYQQDFRPVIPPGAGPMPPFGTSAPVIPIDQYGPRMPEPVIPGMPFGMAPTQPFIPPDHTILRVPGSPPSSSSDGDSRSGSPSSGRTGRPPRSRRSSRSSRSPTPVPMPPPVPVVVSGSRRSPSVVYVHSDYPPGSRPPEQFQPSQVSQGGQPQGGPTIINIPGQQQQQPHLMPGGIVPPGMIPGGAPVLMPGGQYAGTQPNVVVMPSRSRSPVFFSFKEVKVKVKV